MKCQPGNRIVLAWGQDTSRQQRRNRISIQTSSFLLSHNSNVNISCLKKDYLSKYAICLLIGIMAVCRQVQQISTTQLHFSYTWPVPTGKGRRWRISEKSERKKEISNEKKKRGIKTSLPKSDHKCGNKCVQKAKAETSDAYR